MYPGLAQTLRSPKEAQLPPDIRQAAQPSGLRLTADFLTCIKIQVLILHELNQALGSRRICWPHSPRGSQMYDSSSHPGCLLSIFTVGHDERSKIGWAVKSSELMFDIGANLVLASNTVTLELAKLHCPKRVADGFWVSFFSPFIGNPNVDLVPELVLPPPSWKKLSLSNDFYRVSNSVIYVDQSMHLQ
ncbi:hypothetical protein K503DRAFT_779836 [Rhizopogon vinicolor AM-OR11-026]|uniref:Uncharacterized protein n=1 Tax=Rhizopogon vinicolor AM-OR11-026 TaxID=1314800 RepID=A0A1B7NCN9_9AGAM|nr:hypothetical protein K503DRAFT_779836 [Rhizopogon vinicolor AM-OR11-026]